MQTKTGPIMPSGAALLRILVLLTFLGFMEYEVYQLVDRLGSLVHPWFKWWYWALPLLGLIPVSHRYIQSRKPLVSSFSRTVLVGFWMSHFIMLPLLVLTHL
ncbi:MAG: hypothetical protein AAF705_19300, partial [Bacteroidota bacterium]